MSEEATPSIKNTKDKKTLTTIGPSTFVDIGAYASRVPAKIDTGAESSAIWASNIHIREDDVLEFSLFGEGSQFYSGEILHFSDYKVMVVRSAMGEEQIRYRVSLPVVISGRKIRALFSLSDRSRNNFPILIGRRTLQGKFLVDVSLPDVEYEIKPKSRLDLKEFRQNPHRFHQKYVANLNKKK